jgi:hypothetical protein
MSATLAELAAALRTAAATVHETGRPLPAADPGEAPFGADGPGRLGALGRRLHDQWRAALDARSREAGAHARRLAQAAETVDRIAARYGDTEDTVRRRLPEVS